MINMELENVFNEFAENYLDRIRINLNEADGIVIFGAGILGTKIAIHLQRLNHKIFGFADNNDKLWGSEINDIPIYSLSDASLKFHNSLCIISIWNPRFRYEIIRSQLKDLKFSNIVHAAQLLQLFSEDLLPHYHFENPQFYFKNKNQIKEVYDLLGDVESKKQFINQLKYRLTIDFESLPSPDSQNQYFPIDLIKLKRGEVFLDAGAYDGDTYFEFNKRVNNSYTKYIALEPDPLNYELIKSNLTNAHDVLIEPYAVGSKHEFLNFNSTGGEGASINNDGDISVECVTIDEKYKIYNPTFLKFDIEGAELDALKGAVNLIKDCTPTIAVCIYHKPQDIFEIPLWLKSVNSNYNFFVRTHGSDGFEFVLYALAKKL